MTVLLSVQTSWFPPPWHARRLTATAQRCHTGRRRRAHRGLDIALHELLGDHPSNRARDAARVSVEAKADETFGEETIEQALSHANPDGNLPARIGLCSGSRSMTKSSPCATNFSMGWRRP
jgi:hypothetical protein